ncbi:hypothetical protein Tco_0520030 [Tanacetum coccineum]
MGDRLAARSGGRFTPRLSLSFALHSEGILPSDSLSTLLPSLFRASSNSTTLPFCLWERRDHVRRTGVVSLTLAGLGVLAVKVEMVMGGSSPTFGSGKGVSVEKPGGGVPSLSFVMLENNGKAIGTWVINTVRDVKENQPRQQDLLADDLEDLDLDCDDLQLHTTSIFKADHVDAFDSVFDEAPTASAIFMARLPLQVVLVDIDFSGSICFMYFSELWNYISIQIDTPTTEIIEALIAPPLSGWAVTLELPRLPVTAVWGRRLWVGAWMCSGPRGPVWADGAVGISGPLWFLPWGSLRTSLGMRVFVGGGWTLGSVIGWSPGASSSLALLLRVRRREREHGCPVYVLRVGVWSEVYITHFMLTLNGLDVGLLGDVIDEDDCVDVD